MQIAHIVLISLAVEALLLEKKNNNKLIIEYMIAFSCIKLLILFSFYLSHFVFISYIFSTDCCFFINQVNIVTTSFSFGCYFFIACLYSFLLTKWSVENLEFLLLKSFSASCKHPSITVSKSILISRNILLLQLQMT